MSGPAYRLDHVGIAVVSIEESLGVYRALGLTESGRETVESQGVVTAFLPLGETRLELLEPTDAHSPVAKFLAKRGPGVHHLCFAVADLERALADLKHRGFRLVNESPVPGAGGKRVAFLHPSAGHGVLIELYIQICPESPRQIVVCPRFRKPWSVPGLRATVFFPVHRVERVFADETCGEVASYAERFRTIVGEDARRYLG